MYDSKTHIAINHPQNTPFPLNTQSCCYIKHFWKSSFLAVFNCTVVSAAYPESIQYLYLHGHFDLKSKKLQMPDGVIKLDESLTQCFRNPPFYGCTQQQHPQGLFFIPHEDTQKRELTELVQKMSRTAGHVFLK